MATSKKIKDVTRAEGLRDCDLLLADCCCEGKECAGEDCEKKEGGQYQTGTRSVRYADVMKPAYEKIGDLHPDCAGAHNGIFRGKDITSKGMDAIAAAIKDGKFTDLYIGDYFDVTINTPGENTTNGTLNDGKKTADTRAADTKNNTAGTEVVRCTIAGFDYYYGCGATEVKVHHAVIVPRNCFKTLSQMNGTSQTYNPCSSSCSKKSTCELDMSKSDKSKYDNVNEEKHGGYYFSCMHQCVLPKYEKALRNAKWGANPQDGGSGTPLKERILTFSNLLSNAVSKDTQCLGGLTGASTGWEWHDVAIQLMSEQQVFGTRSFASSGYDGGVDVKQLPLFALDPSQIPAHKNTDSSGQGDATRQWYWLRSVASGAWFCDAGGYGGASYGDAAACGGVRPLFLIGTSTT